MAAKTTLRGLPGSGKAKTDKLAIAVSLSEDRKVGMAAATHATHASCPVTCNLHPSTGDGDCYAGNGNVGLHMRRLNSAAVKRKATPAEIADAEADAIDRMVVVPGLPLRIHVGGDSASNYAAQRVSGAAERYRERGGGQPWAYTAAWESVDRANWRSVSVLASCQSEADIPRAQARGYLPAIVVDADPIRKRKGTSDPKPGILALPNGEAAYWRNLRRDGVNLSALNARESVHSFVSDVRERATNAARFASGKAWRADDGSKRLPCLEQTGKAETCVKCGVCLKADKFLPANVVVTFRRHR